MTTVGTQTGSVHRQREGTGLAHILTGDKAVDTYGRLWEVGQAERQKRDAAAAAKKDAAIKGLKEFAPEFAYQHRQEIQPQLEGHIQKGAEMMAGGGDPFTGVSPEAIAWQKEHQRISALAQHSMQVQKENTALMQDLEKTDPSEYTAESLQAALQWRDTPLSKLFESGAARPPLQKKRAWTDASEFIGKNMRLWEEGHEGAEPRAVEDFVTNLLQQPANADKIAAYAQKFAELPEKEKERITNAAKDGGREVMFQMGLEDALRYQKGKEPFDYQKEMDKSATDATSRISYSEWQKGDTSGRAPKKGEIDKQAQNAAEETFNSRPDWATYFDRNGELPRGKEETDASYFPRVKGLLAKKVKDRMKADSEYKVTPTGAGDAKKKESSDLFVQDISGSDLTAANSAANLLTGTTYAGNMKVENAWVNRVMNPEFGTMMSMIVATPMSLAEVKKTIVDDGIASEDVQVVERQGKKQIEISFRPGAGGRQSAARLYDNFMKETGMIYEPKHTEREVRTAAGKVISTQATPPAAPNQNAGPLDNLPIFK